MNKVHVVLINGGVWFVASSKEKVRERLVRELGKETVKMEDDLSGEEVEVTVDKAMERMYLAGSCGEMVKVVEEDLYERGDDYVDVAITDVEVDGE